ncbi:endospore germination permease [Pontibacillus sp. ALD_SL1]|uniref:GerAB/ArcD/ProY family transporter n=1 Tax=Pontibacillus sp. ALD_SL1 TaxID=2777185 RepID=UPI001A95C93C|nr:endospore germination permease [Pontibacillus sp. ALD_SL1]QST01109.1 endospore germination permease [Pontibacillus sp. ALD_SL1]
MNGKEEINMRQFLLFLFLFVIGTSILLSPSTLAYVAKESAWLSVVGAIIIGSVFILFFLLISIWYPEQNIVDLNRLLFGKWVGTVFSLLFILFALVSAATVLWTIGNFMITQMLHETPQPFTHMLFMFVVIYGVYLGIETIARVSELFFPYVALLLLVIFLFSIPSIDLNYIKPFFNTGTQEIAKSAWFDLSVSTFPLVVLFMVYPKLVQDKKKVARKVTLAYILGMLTILAATFITTSVLGVAYTSHHLYPTYVLAKTLNIEGLIQRVEVIIAVSWILTIFFKLSLYFYAAVTALSQVLKMKSYRSLTFPLGVFVIALSLIVYPSSIYATEWNQTTWIYYSATFGVLYPLLIAIATFIRKMLKRY